MSIRRVALPFFPKPPEKYDYRYFAEWNRSFRQFIEIVLNPGEARATKIVLTDLQNNNDQGLEEGTLYRVGSDIKVSVLDVAALASSSMTSTSGTLTVTIT